LETTRSVVAVTGRHVEHIVSMLY